MTDWQPVIGWEYFYEVNREGLIRKAGDKHVIGQWENDNGYFLVRLSNPRKMARVHRLVAEAFVENPNSKPFVNHVDNNRSNNNADNLEWCTQLENIRHADKQGRIKKDYWIGKRSPNASLSDEQVHKVKELRKLGYPQQKIASQIGTSKRTVQRILSGEYYGNV